MEPSKLPWKVMVLGLKSSGEITDRSVYVVCGETQIMQMNCELPIEEQIANAEYIVLSANAYPKMVEAFKLVVKLRKNGMRHKSPESTCPACIAESKIESLLTELGEMPEKEE